LLVLDRTAIMHGEVWRLVTYIFIPQMASMLPLPDWANVAFYVLFLWWMGNGLETAWGAFTLTLFYLVGMIGTTIAALCFDAAVDAWHRWAVSGETRLIKPHLPLRVARDGEEYCVAHLPTVPIPVKRVARMPAPAA